MERELLNYIESVKSDVAALVFSDGVGASYEDKFTEYCIEKLDGSGKSEGAQVLSYIHPDSQGRIDWKLNGYCLRDEIKDDQNKTYYETLDLFITYFRNDEYEYNITSAEFTKGLNQIKKFLNSAIKGHIDYLSPSQTELIELVKIISEKGGMFDRINVYYLINGTCNQQKEKVDLNGVEILVHIWDIKRFFKLDQSLGFREPIEILFNEDLVDNGLGLQCLKVPNIDDSYECYLAIIPGTVLAKLYKEYSNELLESNVRAFLGQTGKFNKGIRDTIRTKPHMFLPYNNGITATAENVEVILSDNQLYIKKLTDFQIVNGGQTTASLFHTSKKYNDADLSKIFVQMKLTVIKDVNQKNEEVPNIAKFANSQNKVSELDLSSNNKYFIQIEALSRTKPVLNIENRNQPIYWYFERTNGQYREALNKLATPSKQKAFKEQNPSSHKFVKSDVSKFINLWELEPFMVSQGAQKNFVHYTKKINELVKANKLPGENFYKKLIGNAILFRSVDKLFGRKNIDAIGDTNLKSFTVSYTISYFHYLTKNRLDLWKIYNEQNISQNALNELKRLLVFVFNHLIQNSAGTLPSEYAKREKSWETLKNQHYEFNEHSIQDYLISLEEKNKREIEVEVQKTSAEDGIISVSKVMSMGRPFWNGLMEALKNNSMEIMHLDVKFVDAFEVYTKLKDGRNLDPKTLKTALNILEKFEKNNDPYLLERISKYSTIKEEAPTIDLLFLYDKAGKISKSQWEQIISLGEKTNIFVPDELRNLRSLMQILLRKERPKEQSLVKGYESILKLKKFKLEFF
ncbi:AIPR family protein [Aquirufa aurantiipilula]